VIFVTIGSVFPFDRMIRAADDWAAANPEEEVFAQIGDGGYEPRHMIWVRRLDRETYDTAASRARLLVAHAGMGSVITAGRFGKPIVILPRRHALGEHNTDHQADTAAWLSGRSGIYLAEDESVLGHRIEAALARPEGLSLPSHAPKAFTDRLRAAILGLDPPHAGVSYEETSAQAVEERKSGAGFRS
jgi:UDP-N-acetylglucosamine transferase subunit ALG13